MSAKPYIVSSPFTCWGAPRIRGTRVTVDAIYDLYGSGESIRAVAEWYDITRAQVRAAIRYYEKRKAK